MYSCKSQSVEIFFFFFLAGLLGVEGFESVTTGVAVGCTAVREGIADCAWAGRKPRIQSYPMCRMSMCGEVTEKLVPWKHLLLFLCFRISKSEFKMGIEGCFVLFSGKCHLLLINFAFDIKLNISFLLGNVYFDVKSWGKRYGVLTTISPDIQDEAGRFMSLPYLY